MLPLKLFAHDKLPIQAPPGTPHVQSASSKEGQGPPVRKGRVKRRGRKWGWTEEDRKGGGQPPKWRVCRAARPRGRHSPARPLVGVGRNARGAGRAGLAAQPERVREGAGQSPLERQLRTTTQSWGGGALASAGGGRDKQGGARESGRPPPPSQRGHCRSAPAPRPAAALAHRPPQPSGRRPGPRTERGKFPGRPSPPAAAPRDPRAAHLAPPAAVARAGQLPLGQLDSELQLPPLLPAHPVRPTTRLRSDRPPAEAQFAPTWPACPPSPGHCAHVRGRGHNPARIPSREGSGGARQPASERTRLGDTPPAPVPAPHSLPPAPGDARARARPGLSPATRARSLPTHPPRARMHSTGRS